MAPRPRPDPRDRDQGTDLRRVLEGFDVGVVVRRMEIGFSSLPAYTGFPWPVDRGAVVRWNVDLTLRWTA
jgi:hypothetical protein